MVHKKDEILPFSAIWMDLRRYNAKWNKSDKDKHYIISLMCVVSKIQQSMNMKVLVVQSREGNGTPLLPGKSHGWRSLEGCSPRGHCGSNTTEQLHFHLSLSCIGEGNGNPLQCSCLENPRDRRAWWAAIYGVAQSRTWLKWLSSSSRGKCSYFCPHAPCQAVLSTLNVLPYFIHLWRKYRSW